MKRMLKKAFLLVVNVCFASCQSVDPINQCVACDWKRNFCGWLTTTSSRNATIHWTRVESFYPKKSVDDDVNEVVVMSSARRTATYYSGQQDTRSSSLTGDGSTIDMTSCTVADAELPAKIYLSRSSFLQIYQKPFSCNGEIVAWRYLTIPSSTNSTRQIYASVWEPLAFDSSVLVLVGWNLLPAGTVNQWEQFNINKPDRIRVKAGQYIGLHYATAALDSANAVVPHLEAIDSRTPNANWTFPAYVFNMSHGDVEEQRSLKLNPSIWSRRLPAIRAIVRAIRSRAEFQHFGDYYAVAEALPSLPVVGKARLTSPEIQPLPKSGRQQLGHCLFFRYFLKHGLGQRSSLTVWFIGRSDRRESEWETLLTRNSETFNGSVISTVFNSPVSPPWSYAAVKIGKRDEPYRIMFEANPALGGAVALGEVDITPEPCTYTRETDILIPVSTIPYGLLQNNMMWTDGQIPYVIDADFSAEEVRLILESMDVFRITCINFKPHSPGNNQNWLPYVRFRRPNAYCQGYSRPVCASFVGPQSPETLAPFGEHPVFLDRRCFYPQGRILHLLAHVVGLWHETNRASREKFININWDSIAWYRKADFELYPTSSTSYSDLDDFDVESVTHLPDNAYADDGFSNTFSLKNSSFDLLAQRYRLSAGDVAKIKFLYSDYKSCAASTAAPSTTTITPSTTSSTTTTITPNVTSTLPITPSTTSQSQSTQQSTTNVQMSTTPLPTVDVTTISSSIEYSTTQDLKTAETMTSTWPTFATEQFSQNSSNERLEIQPADNNTIIIE